MSREGIIPGVLGPLAGLLACSLAGLVLGCGQVPFVLSTSCSSVHGQDCPPRETDGSVGVPDATVPGDADAGQPLPDAGAIDDLTVHGAGPRGTDDGTRFPCTGVTAAGPQVLCVVAGAAAGGNGTVARPFATIGAAVALARDGDVVQVAGGEAAGTAREYREGVQVGAYVWDPPGDGRPGDEPTCDAAGTRLNLRFLGGFTSSFGARDARRHQTLVVGDARSPAFVVCVKEGTTVLDGFHLTSENRNRGLVATVGGWSGEGGTLVVSHNVAFENTPTPFNEGTAGGGLLVRVLGAGRAEISDNWSHHNTAGRGAGIAASTDERGADTGTLRILRNRVAQNVSHSEVAGGMDVGGSAEVGHNACLWNRVGLLGGWGGLGGGLYGALGEYHLHHNVFVGNHSVAFGGSAVFLDGVTGRVEYDFVRGNGCAPAARSSAIRVDDEGRTSSLHFQNVTVVDHHCPEMALGVLTVQGMGVVSVDASVFWDNVGVGGARLDFGVDGTRSVGAVFTVTNTVSGQFVPGPGNSTADPALVAPGAGNFHSQTHPDRGAFAPGGLEILP